MQGAVEACCDAALPWVWACLYLLLVSGLCCCIQLAGGVCGVTQWVVSACKLIRQDVGHLAQSVSQCIQLRCEDWLVYLPRLLHQRHKDSCLAAALVPRIRLAWMIVV